MTIFFNYLCFTVFKAWKLTNYNVAMDRSKGFKMNTFYMYLQLKKIPKTKYYNAKQQETVWQYFKE